MTTATTILIITSGMVPSLIYNYQYYKKHKQQKAEFILINCVAGLIVFTIYLGLQLPN